MLAYPYHGKVRLLGRVLVVALVSALGNGIPCRGHAADETAGAAGSAKALYKQGRTHYQLGEYREALTEFKEAYRLKQDASFLFNIGQCHRQLGEYAEAIKLYGSYLREAPDAPNRAEVERFVREMKEALEKREKHEPPRASSVAPAPAPAAVPAPPGPEAGPAPSLPPAAGTDPNAPGGRLLLPGCAAETEQSKHNKGEQREAV